MDGNLNANATGLIGALRGIDKANVRYLDIYPFIQINANETSATALALAAAQVPRALEVRRGTLDEHSQINQRVLPIRRPGGRYPRVPSEGGD